MASGDSSDRRRPIRTALITGASGGIGAESAKRLAKAYPEAKIVLAVRDEEKAKKNVIDEVKSNGNVVTTPVDFMSLESSVQCATNVQDLLENQPLDLLICNAGIMAPPFGTAYSDKTEQQWAVNYISQMAVLEGLLPSLRAAEGNGRIVFVSSSAAYFVKGYKKLEVARKVSEANYKKWESYGESKLAQAMAAVALRDREPNITSVSLHPGVVSSELGRSLLPKSVFNSLNSPGPLQSVTRSVFGLLGVRTPFQGSNNSVYLSTAPSNILVNGGYYHDNRDVSDTLPILSNAEECSRFYEATLDRIAKLS